MLLPAAFAASLAAMVWGVTTNMRWVVWAGAIAFALAAILAALITRSRSLKGEVPESDPVVRSLIEYTPITAYVYAWAAASMLTIYSFTGIRWRHGWQYGSAMLLIAAGLTIYFILMRDETSVLRSRTAIERIIALTVLHGLGAATALIWLLSSGKLATLKGDWAANAIFVSGAAAIAVISAIIINTHRTLTSER